MITLTLPWPPSVNTYWRHVGPRVLISANGRQYRKAVSDLVMVARVRRQLHHGPLAGRVALRIEATPPDRRARDLDNLLKAPLDALTHAGIWIDDAQIHELTIVKLSPQRNGGELRVVVESMDSRAAA